MTQQNDEDKPAGIPDEALPDDLVPGEENPLAEGLPPGETAEGLLTEGKTGDQAPYAAAEGSGTDGETGDPPPPEESAEPQEA